MDFRFGYLKSPAPLLLVNFAATSVVYRKLSSRFLQPTFVCQVLLHVLDVCFPYSDIYCLNIFMYDIFGKLKQTRKICLLRVVTKSDQPKQSIFFHSKFPGKGDNTKYQISHKGLTRVTNAHKSSQWYRSFSRSLYK